MYHNKTMENYEWFVKNYNNIFKEYGECFVCVYNKQIVGKFKTYKDGVLKMSKKYELGSFLIQRCCRDKFSATNAFVSSVNF